MKVLILQGTDVKKLAEEVEAQVNSRLKKPSVFLQSQSEIESTGDNQVRALVTITLVFP